MAGLWLLAVPSHAQKKEIEEAQTIIKSGKKVEQAEKLMVDLLKKDSANRKNPKIFATWFDAVESQYVQANEKLYLKQKYDTAAFFNLTRHLFDIAEALDSLDALPNKRGRVKLKYREDNSELLDRLRINLYYGGTFHVRKNDFAQAYDYFHHYLDAAQQPLFSTYQYAEKDSMMPQVAYWATYSGYRLQDAEKTLYYVELAKNYQPRVQYVLQYQCEAYLLQKRQEAYLQTLREGFRQFPEYPYFFPRLADYYTAQGQSDSLMYISEYGLQVNGEEPLFLLAKSMALLQTNRYDECIAVSKLMIAANDTLPEPYYNIGTCYLNQALELEHRGEPRKYRQELQRLYAAARPYMEKYRQLMPADRQRWAPALYRIYLNLNMGKQFEEIDKLMR